MMKTKIWWSALLLAFAQHIQADTIDGQIGLDNGPALSQCYIDSRFAYQGERVNGHNIEDSQGFRGQYFLLRMDGQIAKGFNFSYRQRLNKYSKEASFFDATDWLNLTWSTRRFSLTAGKVVAAIGGFEYDLAPIDLYCTSEFWNQIPCFQLGASAGYSITPHDNLSFQVCNSPFRSWEGNHNNALGYSLMWSGQHGIYESLWSVNLFESSPNHWINFISLGNRFHFGKRVQLMLDFQNRASKHQTFLFKDCTLVADLSVRPVDALNVTAKYTYDVNKSGTDTDLLVHNGTELHRVSLHVEAEPLKNHRNWVRVFAAGGWGWGRNTNPEGTIADLQLVLQAGVKFRIDFFEGLQMMLRRYHATR